VQLQNKGEVASVILLLYVKIGSYHKNKIGVPLFWTTQYITIQGDQSLVNMKLN